MATDKQINANRRNAKKSTGPRTPEGKRRVSSNALKHGLSASKVVIPGEDVADYERLRDGFVEALEPRDEVELALVRQMVTAEWRMRRVDHVEVNSIRHRIRREWKKRSADIEGTPEEIEAQVADIVFYAECVQGDAISKYARYNNAFNRQFHRAYKLLSQRELDPEPGGGENDGTKPISDSSPEIQRDTAYFTKPDGPRVSPDPARAGSEWGGAMLRQAGEGAT